MVTHLKYIQKIMMQVNNINHKRSLVKFTVLVLVVHKEQLMKCEQITAVISIVISLISVGVTIYNAFKQREIEERLQDNEFEYSKRKIWYDKQSQAIDELLEVISLINKQLNEFKESFAWDSDGISELLQFAIKDSDKLRVINQTKRAYLEKDMLLLLKKYIYL